MPIQPLETENTRMFAEGLERARKRRRAQAFEDQQREGVDTIAQFAEGLAPLVGMGAGAVAAAAGGGPEAVGVGTKAGQALSGAIGQARAAGNRKREDAALEGVARQRRLDQILSMYG